jgi:hypothetical protein
MINKKLVDSIEKLIMPVCMCIAILPFIISNIIKHKRSGVAFLFGGFIIGYAISKLEKRKQK